ncbi:MAG: hypothetical protein ACE5IR_05275 [bacterium]
MAPGVHVGLLWPGSTRDEWISCYLAQVESSSERFVSLAVTEWRIEENAQQRMGRIGVNGSKRPGRLMRTLARSVQREVHGDVLACQPAQLQPTYQPLVIAPVDTVLAVEAGRLHIQSMAIPVAVTFFRYTSIVNWLNRR